MTPPENGMCEVAYNKRFMDAVSQWRIGRWQRIKGMDREWISQDHEVDGEIAHEEPVPLGGVKVAYESANKL